ncbi:putative electron transfer flavoprotein subunit [Mortierella sp. GBA30]|nr:putative electron transfer flavoprotein subunit [Mortierella sp. GBA30]
MHDTNHERAEDTTDDIQLEQPSSDDDSEDSDDHDQQDDEEEEKQEQESDEKSLKRHPSNQSGRGQVIVECANCGQTQTPLWRKDAKGKSICNACGLYARLHHRDRPVTMRKTNIARRKRDWTAAQERVANQTSSSSSSHNGEQNVEHGGTNTKERKTNKTYHAEVRAMNIPVNSEHESDDSTFCALERRNEDNEMSTSARQGSLSPMLASQRSLSPMLDPVPTTTSLGNGALSPSLTASPPTPTLSPPHFLNTAATFPSLNPLLMQQYQQQLQTQILQQQQHQTIMPVSEGMPLVGNSWLTQFYSQYSTMPVFGAAALPRDPMALAALQIQLQQQQQQQHRQQQQPSPFQTKASSPVSPVSVNSDHSFPLPSPTTDTHGLKKTSQQYEEQSKRKSHQPDQRKMGQGPLILDSSRFTRLMNQMSKAQLSMFLTILEERCGALRHRLSGEDDEVERVDTNEMMMMINNPHFTSMEGDLSLSSSASMPMSATPGSMHLMALNDPIEKPGGSKTFEDFEHSDNMV